MPTSREIDENGFLLVKGCPISSFGIFDYGAGQLGLPGDPNRIVKVFRPESAVNDPAAIESFKNVPFIVDHTMLSGFEGDDDGVAAPEDKGVDGVLTSNVYYQAPWMLGDLKIYSRKAQRYLASGKKDLSLGYSCDFELTPGVWNGQAYEVVQTNLRGNHIALVDEGRVPGARVLDGLCFDHLSFSAVQPSSEDKNMAGKGRNKAMDNAVAQLKALLPALEAYLNEEGNEPEHQGNPSPGEPGGSEGGGKDANPMAAAGGTGESSVPSAEGATPPTGSASTQAAPTEASAGAEHGTSGEEGGDPAGADPVTPGTSGMAEQPLDQGGGDINGLISQVEGIVAQIKAAVAGSNGGQGADEGMNENVQDTVTGLQGTRTGEGAAVCADEGEGASVGEGQGKVSPGPSAGIHSQAGDAALRNFYSDLAVKDSFYNRVSKVVGAFDCKTMDSRQVIAYGVKKLGLKCADGTQRIALEAYLNAVESAAKATKQRVQSSKAADSATVTTDEMDAYLNGGK
jgi:hypothetical protein